MLSAVAVQTSPPPSVRAVYVSGSEWSQLFKDYVATTTLNSSPAYGIGVYLGTSPPRPDYPRGQMPWVNIDRISARFSDDMRVEVDDLRVLGVNVAETSATSVAYDFDPVNYEGTATWTFGAAAAGGPDHRRTGRRPRRHQDPQRRLPA
jgi:hypothetical protein